MMWHRGFKLAGSTALAALSLAGVLAVSGCEERPYPQSAKSYAPPPSAPSAELAGAPAYSPPVSAAYTAPAYSAPTPQPYAGEGLVAMAPIPNPDEGQEGYGVRHNRVHHRYYTRPVAASKAPVYTPKPVTPAPKYAKAPVVTRPSSAPMPPRPNTYVVEGAVLAADAGAAAGAALATKDTSAPTATISTKPTASTSKPGVAPATSPAASSSDRSTRLATLQSVLTDAISKGAKLTVPEHFITNQPSDVTLTLPATFAATVRDEAGKNGLSDAASSVNLTAVLLGAGFAVTPGETQSQPLTLGQITEFHWTVIAKPGAQGPLHANLGADLLGVGSDTLALGSVQQAAGTGVKLTPKVVGAALLVLIAALIVAWLAREREGPSRSALARRASRAARDRPLDMGMSITPPTRVEPAEVEPAAH